jgi:hypothetical protein
MLRRAPQRQALHTYKYLNAQHTSHNNWANSTCGSMDSTSGCNQLKKAV